MTVQWAADWSIAACQIQQNDCSALLLEVNATVFSLSLVTTFEMSEKHTFAKFLSVGFYRERSERPTRQHRSPSLKEICSANNSSIGSKKKKKKLNGLFW